MSDLACKILEDAQMLSDEERARVASELLAPAAELSATWREELQKRVAALDAGMVKTRAWDLVRADLLELLAKR